METEDLFQVGSRTLVMGVLNMTPDSFSDGGQLTSTEVSLGLYSSVFLADLVSLYIMDKEPLTQGYVPEVHRCL